MMYRLNLNTIKIDEYIRNTDLSKFRFFLGLVCKLKIDGFLTQPDTILAETYKTSDFTNKA